MSNSSVKSLGLFALTMMIVGAIDSIRNMPATALFGTSLVFFFVAATLFFLIPTGLISAELSSTLPEHNGIHDWVKSALGDEFAFIVIWLQWINTMVWYPTILSFIAGILAFLINPALASNRLYLVSVILIVFWSLTLLNLRGLDVSVRFSSTCAVIGMVIPLVIIIFMAALWPLTGHQIQIHFTAMNMIPHFSHGQSWISLTAIITSFLGMELATVHVKNIKNARHLIPKALVFAVIFIMVTMLLGALSIAFVVPANQINLVSGIMQAFAAFFMAYHLQHLLPVLGLMILVGSLGGMINWMISPAKGLLLAGKNGYLPKQLCQLNAAGVPQSILILQGILVSLVCVAFIVMPSVNGSYWLLTDLSTQLYLMMYLLMFLAAIVLRAKVIKVQSGVFSLRSRGLSIMVSLMGLIGCFIALVVGFIPPGNIAVGGFWHYEKVFTLGILLMLSPAIIILFLRQKTIQ